MTTEATTTEEKPLFSTREEEVMRAAWFCLKSFPEVDMQQLVKQAGFNTPKTAINVWGVIKKKLVAALEAKGDGLVVKTGVPASDSAKDASSGKKRGRKAAALNGDGETAPKKQRKTAKKITADDDHPADSDSALSAVKEELLTDIVTTKKRKSPVRKTKGKATKDAASPKLVNDNNDDLEAQEKDDDADADVNAGADDGAEAVPEAVSEEASEEAQADA
ncbi:hypothetical protein AMS68_005000 [Peltaster fructicola]|uniref:Uncharacterized protein n=1 Tax=Peltaster fructicola TaxID=286661 RepID=A0A6H0XXK0_9PEZI|nr:hypothetical protein AMS68_005000 [Peltaster fructicola]